MPEAGETEVTTVIRNSLATRIGIQNVYTHRLQTRLPILTHTSTAQAHTVESEAAHGARSIGLM